MPKSAMFYTINYIAQQLFNPDESNIVQEPWYDREKTPLLFYSILGKI